MVIAAIEAGVPSLVEARTLIDRFHDMIRKKDDPKLDAWIANAKANLVSSFATGGRARGSRPRGMLPSNMERSSFRHRLIAIQSPVA